MARQRLDARLATIWQYRLALVIAPAGSGKTTLLGQFARASSEPVVWYRAEPADRPAAVFLHRLQQACHGALGPVGPSARGWSRAEEMAAALRAAGHRVLLVVDDLHALEGSEAERCLEQLLGLLPAEHVVLAASRRPPAFTLSRLRVSGELLELGADDLRFRTWEVERLFRDLYHEPLAPEDVAELARRTEGWAAGLRLFHLATRGKVAADRRRVLKSLGARSRLVREYLAQNVLDELPERLRAFLLGTCTLGRLNGPLCDELLGAAGSREVLEELERAQLFTSMADEGWYRYHEVLRSHLEVELAERHGAEYVRSSYRRAALLLEREGLLGDAMRAYCCAEDWAAAARLLGRDGEHLVEDCGPWLESLPPAVVDSDPWLLLAAARRFVGAGRLARAAETYRRAESAFGSSATAESCRAERQALQPWTDAATPATAADGWLAVVRQATKRDPAAAMRRASVLAGPTGQLAQGIAAGLAGREAEAERLLGAVAEDPTASPVVAVSAQAAAAALRTLQGGVAEPGADSPAELEAVADAVEGLDLAGLTRVARALVAVGKGAPGRAETTALAAACHRAGDAWGAAVIALLQGCALARAGQDATEPLAAAYQGFHRLGADVLAALARSTDALAAARLGDPTAADAAARAEAEAKAAVAPAALRLACQARASAESGPPLDLRPAGPAAPVKRTTVAAAVARAGPCPRVAVRCFGRFRIAIGAQDVDLSAVKPRARVALQLLALHRRWPVHRETLVCALWPEADQRTGTRNLHVVVSSLRHVLEPDAARGEATLLVRDGESYRLDLPPEAECDIDTFEAGLRDGRAHRERGDRPGAVEAFERSLAVYGDLLPEAGPAEWVVGDRERCRLAAAGAALALAELHRASGRLQAAAEACERGLLFDRYGDDLWRLLIEVHEAAGSQAAARRATEAYRGLLADLGVVAAP